MEEWRDIKGYEGRYQVSNLGRVKSLKDRYGNYREKILNPRNSIQGYLDISLYKNGVSKRFKVHRLVAEAFISNINNYSQVNHKDENKQNNRVENLEWCTSKYNANYGTRNKRHSEKMKGKNKGSKNGRSRKVQCITTGKKFNTIKEAGEYYYIDSYRDIIKSCKGKNKSAGKHPVTGEKLKWKYIDE